MKVSAPRRSCVLVFPQLEVKVLRALPSSVLLGQTHAAFSASSLYSLSDHTAPLGEHWGFSPPTGRQAIAINADRSRQKQSLFHLSSVVLAALLIIT